MRQQPRHVQRDCHRYFQTRNKYSLRQIVQHMGNQGNSEWFGLLNLPARLAHNAFNHRIQRIYHCCLLQNQGRGSIGTGIFCIAKDQTWVIYFAISWHNYVPWYLQRSKDSKQRSTACSFICVLFLDGQVTVQGYDSMWIIYGRQKTCFFQLNSSASSGASRPHLVLDRSCPFSCTASLLIQSCLLSTFHGLQHCRGRHLVQLAADETEFISYF